MTPKYIDYGKQNKDSGTLLQEHGITRDQISEDARVRTVEYLKRVLRGDDAAVRWEFTLNEVTIAGAGWDEAGHFRTHFN